MKLLLLPLAFVTASAFACPGDAAKSAGMTDTPANIAVAPVKAKSNSTAAAVKATESKAAPARVASKAVEARKGTI